jgi:hypothetical protein
LAEIHVQPRGLQEPTAKVLRWARPIGDALAKAYPKARLVPTRTTFRLFRRGHSSAIVVEQPAEAEQCLVRATDLLSSDCIFLRCGSLFSSRCCV